MPIALVVHGGAGNIAAERIGPANEGCQKAAQVGWKLLQDGASALDAVEAVVRVLEDDPNYNAGTGSCLNADGAIEMDAGIMEGQALQVGAVACVERIKNPITLARRVLESQHVLLVGTGARDFALENGFTLCHPEELVTERQYNIWQSVQEEQRTHEPIFHRRELSSIEARVETQESGMGPQTAHEPHHTHAGGEEKLHKPEKHGTVGAVALDAQGHLAAATSTGGFTNKHPGRIGDSPLIGCGFYADENAAISCTGYGEDFIRLLLAKRTAEFVAQGMSARDAAQAAIALLGARLDGSGGLIVVDRFGNVGFSWNSQNMAYAYLSEQ